MAKRLFDVACATVALIAVAPLLLVAAIGIRLSSRGPALYRATRLGLGGRPFTMYKLRTMHVARSAHRAPGGPITGARDPRVFAFGAFLRRTKIDELPQLLNVLRGDMTIVGPRPEDPAIVHRHYAPLHFWTLGVRPGLASPGSLYQYTHGEALLAGEDPEQAYAARLLPTKLALELVYVRRASLYYDLGIIARTLWGIAAIAVGKRGFRPPPEMRQATALLARRRPTLRDRSGAAALLLPLALAASTRACHQDTDPGQLRPPTVDAGPDARTHPGDAVTLVAAVQDSSTGSAPWAWDLMWGDGTADHGSVNPVTRRVVQTHRYASLGTYRVRMAVEWDRVLASDTRTVFALGDNAYPEGAPADYANCYAPTWGRHRKRTHPVPGNHDYQTAGAPGYFGYFGVAAGAPSEGYYSYDLGGWHIIALNSNLDMRPGSAEEQWLRADLAAHPARCTLAYWHHPRFSSG